ncbi:MAG: hypothetical protein Q9M91_03335 [Candidatus Dojkabacteria bacterium]|nr:hypothetical protein [Candidatus Dojkabacteria bacterium]MDQ7020857.1 hypothetical protein [Candidatus Dojkabacteria bacterium]
MKKSILLLLIINTIVWSSLVGFVTGRYYFPNESNSKEYYGDVKLDLCDKEVINCDDFTEDEINSYLRNYLYDRVVLHGKDSKGENFYLVMYVVRKQLAKDQYHQYSTLLYSYNGKTRTLWTSENEKESYVLPNGYIKEYINEDFSDLSTRESFQITLDVDGTDVEIDIENLNGDFIVKNKNDYIRSVSEGDAEVSVDGDKFEVFAVADQIISSDYSKSLIFKGRDELNSETHSITLWDEEENFYHLDITDVENKDLPYKTHRWIIYKDGAEGYVKKAFDANIIDFEMDEGKPSKWVIEIPDIYNTVIELEAHEYINNKNADGTVIGTVTDSRGTRNISGHFLYQLIGK